MSGSVRLFLCILLVQYQLYAIVNSTLVCPKKNGADPSNINGRLKALANTQNEFTYDDKTTKYVYTWHICKTVADQRIAIEQAGTYLKFPLDLGEYANAQVIGGTDWFMITYPVGKAYHSGSHCNKQKRKSSVMVTCDPEANIGSFKLIQEYRQSSEVTDGCFHLFHLNNKAACSSVMARK